MKRSLWLWLLFAGALLAQGCARKASPQARATPPGDGKEAARYYPLAVGNRWTYEVNLLGEKGERTVTLVAEEGGFFRDDSGQRLRSDAWGIRDEKRYLLREPLEEGTAWTNVVSMSSVEKYRIAAVGQPCQAPAGRFEDCIRVESRNRVDERTTLVNEVTFAPNVGIVKVEVVAERGEERIPQTTLSLKSFEVK